MKFRFAFLILMVFSLAQDALSSDFPKSVEDRRREKLGSVIKRDKENGGVIVFGKSIFGSGKSEQDNKSSRTARILPMLVNNYLWQASLEAVQFMPLLVSDSAGGAISTDWYEDSEFQNERYKFNILIKSKKIKSRSVAVSTFKQIYIDGRWKDVKANKAIANEMKNKILSRAKALQSKNKK